MLTDLDHIGIAVTNLDESTDFYVESLGVTPFHRETIESQGVKEVLFRTGSSYIQLLEALGPDTPVGKYMAKWGPGMHHIGYRVDDIVKALAHFKELGVPLIDEVPRIGSLGNTIAFVHPKAYENTLVELVQDITTLPVH